MHIFFKMQYRTPSGPSRKEGKFLILGGSRWFSVDPKGDNYEIYHHYRKIVVSLSLLRSSIEVLLLNILTAPAERINNCIFDLDL